MIALMFRSDVKLFHVISSAIGPST